MEKTEYRMNYRGELYSTQEYEDTFHISLLRKFASAGLVLPDFNDLQPVEVEEGTDINKLKERLKFLYKDEKEAVGYTGYTGYTGPTGVGSSGTIGYTGSFGISSSTTTYSTGQAVTIALPLPMLTQLTGTDSTTGTTETVTTQFITIQTNPTWD